MSELESTIVAIATPAGRGGIGIIRLSGKHALNIAQEIAHRDFQARTPHLCAWYDETGAVIDTGLTLFFPKPASYTGEDVVELQGHGSPVLLHDLLRRCIALGAVPAEAGEFTRRAVMHGCMDLSQAEAVVACIDAATVRAGKQAQKQLAGEFGNKIETLMSALTGIVAHVEACLDFPEEEIPTLFLNQLSEQLQAELIQPMQALLATSTFGERLFSGATVAIVGAPNVGKSSLLNRLIGKNRAIVNETAGTTRDTLEVDFEVSGIPIRLVDTAGLRESKHAIEQEGIKRAKEAAAVADVVIWVMDATRDETWQYSEHYDIALANKTDLLSAPCEYDVKGAIPISAQTGEGIEALMQALAASLGDIGAEGEDIWVTCERHRLAIQQAMLHIENALPKLQHEAQLDLAALDLRQAWSSLGEIIGVGDVEYILDRVFSEFCIGK